MRGALINEISVLPYKRAAREPSERHFRKAMPACFHPLFPNTLTVQVSLPGQARLEQRPSLQGQQPRIPHPWGRLLIKFDFCSPGDDPSSHCYFLGLNFSRNGKAVNLEPEGT